MQATPQPQQAPQIDLNSFAEAARRAYYWNSFDPDKAGQRMVQEFTQYLQDDTAELQANGADAETITNYIERFKRYMSAYISAKSRTASPMITGPARFNNSRNEKARRSEMRHLEVFTEWRKRAVKSIIRQAQPQKTFASELDRYRADLESMKKNHELMKEATKAARQAAKTGGDPVAAIKAIIPGISDFDAEWAAKWGFHLSNNLANIKRVEERIQTLERKQQRAETVGQQVQQFDGFTLTINHEADRIQIKHDTKPDAATISDLKSNGFKWAPSVQCWQRQLTPNAMYALKNRLLPKLTGQPA